MGHIGCKVVVSGLVQGVGFRYFTFKQAEKLALTGHAKNLQNGKVEVLLFGDPDQIEVMLDWLRQGPENARVDQLDRSPIAYVNQNSFTCF